MTVLLSIMRRSRFFRHASRRPRGGAYLALTIGRVFHPSYDKIDELEAISRGKLFGASDGYINPSLLIERVKVIDLSPYKGALNSPVLLQKKTCCGIFKNTAYRINGITYFNTIFNTVDQ